MKVVCSGDKLSEGLQMVGGLVATSTTKPILQAVKMETVGNMLEVSGTDLEVGMRYLVETERVSEPGAVVLPASRIMGLFRDWPGGKVSLDVKDNSCRFSGKGCNFKLLGYRAEEFPTIPSFSDDGCIEVGSELIGEMVRKTAFACASERLRHTMTGVLFSVKDGFVKMVATDGRRMAYMKGKAGNKGAASRDVIIPSKGIQQLPKMTGQSDEAIKIQLGETHMVAKTGSGVLCSQLIEGQFPSYEEAIPKEDGEKLELDAEEFATAVRRAAFLTTEERHLVKIKLKKGKMVVHTETPDVGEGEISMDVKYAGKEVEIGFNPDFILDALKAIGKDTVRLMFKDPNTAATFRVGQNYLYIVMPVRLSES